MGGDCGGKGEEKIDNTSGVRRESRGRIRYCETVCDIFQIIVTFRLVFGLTLWTPCSHIGICLTFHKVHPIDVLAQCPLSLGLSRLSPESYITNVCVS